MKRLLRTVCLLALGSSVPTFGADLPTRVYTKAPAPSPVYDWSGFYVGANGGWGTSRNCSDLGAGGPSIGCHDATGGVVGGQIGYRWQANQWVFGLEAQGDWANLKGSGANLLFPVDTNQSKIDAFGLFTGQVGYAWNNLLLYVKGGAAVTNTQNNIYFAANGPVIAAGTFLAGTGYESRWGGTAGVGLEYGFAANWSAAVAYDHLFMQDKTVNFTSPGGVPCCFAPTHQNVDLVTVRINYRWGGPVVASTDRILREP